MPQSSKSLAGPGADHITGRPAPPRAVVLGGARGGADERARTALVRPVEIHARLARHWLSRCAEAPEVRGPSVAPPWQVKPGCIRSGVCSKIDGA